MVHHGVKDFFRNIAKAARKYKIKHKEFASGAEIRAAFPQFAVSDDDRAFLDLWGGYLRPEACVGAQLRLAEQRHGATLRRGVTIKSMRSSKTGATLTAEDGEVFEADRVLVTAGAWLPRFLPAALRRRFTVTRQVLHWFEIERNVERFSRGELSGVHLGRERAQAAEPSRQAESRRLWLSARGRRRRRPEGHAMKRSGR